jgi:hypothetical protein
MTIQVEINLRIPSVKAPATTGEGYPIRNDTVRFIRDLTVPAVPTPGLHLSLDTNRGIALDCKVLHADWSDRQERFIVYCRYAKRSMPDDEYNALLHDPNWMMRPLV